MHECAVDFGSFNQQKFLHNRYCTVQCVARICCEEGQRWKSCHAALMVDFRVKCSSGSMTNSFVTNAVLIERAVSC